MSEIVIDAQYRATGRSTSRGLRRQGIVPGVYYFHGEEPISIAVTELGLRPLIFTAESHLVRMRLQDGVEKTCILKDITFDPVTDRPTHFDFIGISANEAVTVEVPILITGQAAGSREGGIVDLVLHKLEISCLPANLPDHIEVDITSLGMNDSIHVRELNLPNITVLTPGDATIVLVAPPRVEMEATATPGTAEPELITKGKATDA